jgi:hypothetical protein
MKSFLIQTFAVAGTLGAALPNGEAAPAPRKIERRSGGIWATPHESFSSSVGVLGCKINVDRVAYWPGSIGCDNICVKVTYEGRSVHLLRIDSSEGAHDMSYDAWNYLYTGKGARDQPTMGGAVPMDYEEVDPENCLDIIHTKDKRLPLSAANSMNYLASCLGESDSWVAKNYRLYNVLDPICTLGYDEPCDLDWPAANQASCPNMLGVPQKLTGCPVYNVQYGTGKSVLAGTNQVVDVDQSSDSPAPLSPSVTKISIPYASKATPVESIVPQDSQPQYPKETVGGGEGTGPEVYDDERDSGAKIPGAVYYASPSSTPAVSSTVNSSGSSETSSPQSQPQPKKVEQAAAHTLTIYVPMSILVPILVSLIMG